MSFLDTNMALVEKYHPHLLPLLENLTPATVDTDHPCNFRFQGLWLHDIHNPGNECANHFVIIPPEQPGVSILLGLGLGHAAIRLVRERQKISHFFIFEPYPEIFFQALNQTDCTDLLSDNRVHITIGEPRDINAFLKVGARALRLENIYTLPHPFYQKIDPDTHENLRKNIFKIINQLNISGNTLMEHGSTFFNNRMANLPLLNRHRLLEELYLAFKNYPAVLIAGGPSLNDDIETLKRFPGHALLFAADTVLPVLANNGIIPDFVSSLDYQQITYEKIASTASFFADQINLISMPFVTPKVPTIFPFKEIFWAFTSANMERWMNQLVGGSMENGGAGTVAHMNMIAAITLGCSPIVLLGQDLAFTRKESSHAEGTVLTSPDAVKKLKNSHDCMTVPTNDGGTALTDRRFYDYKVVFEQMIEANKGHYINATLSGAVIEGTEVMSLEEIFDHFCQRTIQTSDIIEKHKKSATWRKNHNLTEKNLKNTLKTTQKLEKILIESTDQGKLALQMVEELIRSGKKIKSLTFLPSKLRSLILKIDKNHSYTDKEKIWQIMDDLTLYGLKKTERMQLEIDSLSRKGSYLEWLSLSLERLNEVARVRLHWLLFFKKKISYAIQRMEKDPEYHPEKYISPIEKLHYYNQTDNLHLARKILLTIPREQKNSPEVLLLQGKLAAFHSNFSMADACLNALQGTELEKEAEIFRQDWGNEYAGYMGGTTSNALYMLKKGLSIAPHHPRLQQLFRRLLRKDLHTTRTNPQEKKNILATWESWFSQNPDAMDLLSPDDLATFLELTAQEHIKENPVYGRKLLELAISKQDSAKKRIQLMETSFLLGDFGTGLVHLEMAVVQNPALAIHWESIGDRLKENGDAEAALEAYQKGYASLSGHAPFSLKIGQILLEQNNIDEARTYLFNYKHLMEKPETQNSCPLDQAEIHLRQNKKNEALKILVSLQDDYGQSSRFWNLFGLACHINGHIADAERCFRQAILLKPDFVQAHYHLGLLFQQNGYPTQAKMSYQNVLIHDPNFPQVYTNLGSMAFDESDFKNAATLFEKVIDLTPEDANAYYNYAKTIEYLGERRQAINSYKIALDLDPSHGPAQKALDHLLQNKGI